jgi:hypothetical protein
VGSCRYDYDGSGFIDVSELRGVLADLGDAPQPEAEVVALIRKYDTNGDGLLDLYEFSDLMVDATIQRFEVGEGSSTESLPQGQQQAGQAPRATRRASRTAAQQAALREVEAQAQQGGATAPLRKEGSMGQSSEGRGGGKGGSAESEREDDEDEDEEGEEQEEVPEDLKHLTWAEQQRR